MDIKFLGTYKAEAMFFESLDKYSDDKSKFESICATFGVSREQEYLLPLACFGSKKQIMDKARTEGKKFYEYDGYPFLEGNWLMENFSHQLGKSKEHFQLFQDLYGGA